MRLFHLSPLKLEYIDPAYSQGREKVVWFVKSRNLRWAKTHLEKRHGQPMEYVHGVNLLRKNLRHRYSGVYTCRDVVKVAYVLGVKDTIYAS